MPSLPCCCPPAAARRDARCACARPPPRRARLRACPLCVARRLIGPPCSLAAGVVAGQYSIPPGPLVEAVIGILAGAPDSMSAAGPLGRARRRARSIFGSDERGRISGRGVRGNGRGAVVAPEAGGGRPSFFSSPRAHPCKRRRVADAAGCIGVRTETLRPVRCAREPRQPCVGAPLGRSSFSSAFSPSPPACPPPRWPD